MSSANDNSGGVRRIRDGLLTKWSGANFAEIATDDALERLADARNAASKTANTFMLFAAVSAFLYALKIEGLAEEISVGQFTLSNLPFGVFVLCATSLVLSSVSFIRAGDSRGFDRLLRLACDQKYTCDCELRYLAFPNSHAWGEPFSQISHAVDAGMFARAIRFIGLAMANLFLMVVILAPLITGVEFLFSDRVSQDVAYTELRQYSIIFLTLSNASMLLLLLWVRFVDRD